MAVRYDVFAPLMVLIIIELLRWVRETPTSTTDRRDNDFEFLDYDGIGVEKFISRTMKTISGSEYLGSMFVALGSFQSLFMLVDIVFSITLAFTASHYSPDIDPIGFVFLFVIGFSWIFVPLLTIPEYDGLSKKGKYAASYEVYFIVTILQSILIWVLMRYFWEIYPGDGLPPLTYHIDNWFSVVLFLFAILILLVKMELFFNRLHQEMTFLDEEKVA